jgi:hypothetical protein
MKSASRGTRLEFITDYAEGLDATYRAYNHLVVPATEQDCVYIETGLSVFSVSNRRGSRWPEQQTDTPTTRFDCPIVYFDDISGKKSPKPNLETLTLIRLYIHTLCSTHTSSKR